MDTTQPTVRPLTEAQRNRLAQIFYLLHNPPSAWLINPKIQCFHRLREHAAWRAAGNYFVGIDVASRYAAYEAFNKRLRGLTFAKPETRATIYR